MNRALRRVWLVLIVMFLLLFGSTTWIQAVKAQDYNADPRNVRTLYSEYGKHRGPILAGGSALAQSVPVDDAFGYQRVYDPGEMYAAVTGYYSVVYGASGIEGAMNEELSGDADALFYQRISDLLSGERGQGATVRLTLDAGMQEAAWDALGDRRGAVVAMDTATGEVLAMVSRPTYDPTRLATHDGAKVREAWQELTEDPADPLANRAIGGDLYPAGSTMKLLVAATALESGSYTPASVVPGPGSLTLPQSSHTVNNRASGAEPCGPEDRSTLTVALADSCNTSFALLGMELGEDALAEQADEFGFGQELEIPLTVTPSRLGQDLSPAQVALTSLGQFDVRVTPLQMAMVSSAVANDGVLMEPQMVQAVETADLEPVSEPRPQELSQPLSASNAAEMRQMMEAVTASGTGTSAAVPGATTGGKTGTAEWGDGSQPAHSWYTGYAETDERSIAVAVIVEQGGYGSASAAPVAREVTEEGLGL